jgi:hypothetical protein
MAFRVLGQSAPAATTNTDLYTVPAGLRTVCSTLAVANRSASAVTYRLAVRPAGAALANQHYIAYDVSLAANSSDLWTAGISLSATDVVTVYASSASMSFSLFGDEAS